MTKFKQVSFVITDNESNDALRDCTVGKTYRGVFIPQGSRFAKAEWEEFGGSATASRDTVLFKDDVGDEVDAFIFLGGIESVTLTKTNKLIKSSN